MDTTKVLLRITPTPIRKKIEGSKELRKVIDNINWLSGEKILRLGLGIIITALVARYLGPEKFGMMNYALAFVGLFVAFNKLGLDGIVVRNIVKNSERKEEYLGSSLLLRIIGSLLLFAFSIVGINILRPESTLMLIFVAIVAVGHLFKSFETIDLWFQSQVKSKYTVYSRSIAFFVISGLKLLFIFTQQPLIAFVMMFALDSIIAAIGLVVFYQLKGPVPIFNWKIKFDTMKELLNDSWPLILSGIAVAIYMKVDQVMIGSMMNDSALGVYSAAVKVSEAWYFLPMAITASVFPAIIKARKKSEELYLNRMQMLYNAFTWFTISVSLIVTLLAPFIINLLYGAEYSGAATVLSIHIWAGVFVFLGVASSKYLIAENLTKISFYRTFLGAITNIILNLILIPFYGIVGAAIATLLSYFIATFSLVLFNKTRKHTMMLAIAFNLFQWILLCKKKR